MDEIGLDLDPAMIDNMRREAENHEFDELDEYVQWLLERRDTILNEYDVWENPPGAVADPDADLAQTSGGSLAVEENLGSEPSLDSDAEEAGSDGFEFPEEEGEGGEEEDVELPEEDGADDDDVAAALEDLDLEDE